jgi:hypothetical protein
VVVVVIEFVMTTTTFMPNKFGGRLLNSSYGIDGYHVLRIKNVGLDFVMLETLSSIFLNEKEVIL